MWLAGFDHAYRDGDSLRDGDRSPGVGARARPGGRQDGGRHAVARSNLDRTRRRWRASLRRSLYPRYARHHSRAPTSRRWKRCFTFRKRAGCLSAMSVDVARPSSRTPATAPLRGGGQVCPGPPATVSLLCENTASCSSRTRWILTGMRRADRRGSARGARAS